MKTRPFICVAALLAATLPFRSHADNVEEWSVNLDFASTSLQSVYFDATDQDVADSGGITGSIADDGDAVITVEGSNGGNTLSKDTADWFEDKVGTGAAIACKTSSESPDMLYFAFIGNLTATVDGGNQLECDNLVMGMGSTDASFHQNWWLGGPGLSRTSTGNLQQSCTYNGAEKTVTFSAPSGCVNTFSVSIDSD